MSKTMFAICGTALFALSLAPAAGAASHSSDAADPVNLAAKSYPVPIEQTYDISGPNGLVVHVTQTASAPTFADTSASERTLVAAAVQSRAAATGTPNPQAAWISVTNIRMTGPGLTGTGIVAAGHSTASRTRGSRAKDNCGVTYSNRQVNNGHIRNTSTWTARSTGSPCTIVSGYAVFIASAPWDWCPTFHWSVFSISPPESEADGTVSYDFNGLYCQYPAHETVQGRADNNGVFTRIG